MKAHAIRRIRGRWGIGHVLVMLVLAALAPFIALEAYGGLRDVRQRQEAIIQRAAGQVEAETETMDDFVRFTERYLSTLAFDPAVRNLDLPRVEELFQAVRELNRNYENVFLLRPNGEQIASTVPFVSDPAVTERNYFRDALASDRVALSAALVWPETDRSVVVFARRVIGPDGTTVAVVAAALNLARLNSVIGFVPLPPDSIVLLAQEDGTVIAASAHPERWVGKPLTGDSLPPNIKLEGSGETAIMPDGVERSIAFRRLSVAPWVMVAGIPQAEVEAARQATLVRIAQQVTLAGLATALLSWIVLRRVVVPIQMLSEGARAFAAGFLNRRIPIRRPDELGDLADALNRMAESLGRRLEEEAAHAQALRDLNQLQMEFVATASHELRTPVTAIRTYAEALLRSDITDETTRQECLAGIDRSSDRLARLVRTLLDVSRIDSGQIAVQLGPVDVNTVVRAALAQAAPGAEDGLHVDVPADLPRAVADPDRLEDVLANLLGNARKFSPPGAPVTVRARARGATVAISVSDQGAGIPAAELERIFGRFYQVQRGAGRGAGGAGLGLYIASAYVTAMQGEIHAESTPGAGSTFTVTLPVVPAPAPAEKVLYESAAHAPAG